MSEVDIARVCVIGAGTMGHGIAQVCAMAGLEVTMVDTAVSVLEDARARVDANLRKGVARGKVAASVRDGVLSRLQQSTDLESSCAACDLVIEAVPEIRELKEAVLRRASAAAPQRALISSNASSMSITALAACTDGPERFVGLHFFSPVHIMSLLEIVRGQLTSESTLAKAKRFAAALGKTAILVSDSPGFATSRLGVAIGLEAIRMVEAGVASPRDIDTAMELAYRFPMGPLRFGDLVGLDVRLSIAEHMYRELGTDTFRPPQLLKQMVRSGKLGKKSGQGFYQWPAEDSVAPAAASKPNEDIASGTPDQAASVTVHPTAVVDDGAVIGAGTKIWHFCHVMGDTTLGEGCSLGQNVFVANGVSLGDNVKVQNNVSIYTGVECEDDVFLGPSMVFTNVINPRSHVTRKDEYRRTLVSRGASVGANATIVCGTTLGQYSFVGAGSVVTHDVPDFGLVYGVPARLRGFVCRCGVNLDIARPNRSDGGTATCGACGSTYAREGREGIRLLD